jgi:tryptophan-rich sensory protein
VVFWLAWPTKDYLPDMERRHWRDLDYLSSFLLIAGSVLIVFAFQSAGFGSNPKPWSAAVFWWPLGCGMMSVSLLFVWEFLLRQNTRGRRLATAIPLDLLNNRVYCFAILHSLLLGFAYMLCIYTFPLRFQVVYHKSSWQAGLMLLPMLGAGALGSIAAGPLNHNRHNRLCETLMAASLFMLIGCALETLAQPVQDLEPKVVGPLALIGFGFGLSASGSTMLCAAESSMREHGMQPWLHC